MENVGVLQLVLILTISLAIVLVIIFIISAKMRQTVETDHAQRIYLKLCKKLSQAGYAKKPSEGAQSYLQNIQKRNRELGMKLTPILDDYIELRYRQNLDQAEILKQFEHAVSQLKLVSRPSDVDCLEQDANSLSK